MKIAGTFLVSLLVSFLAPLLAPPTTAQAPLPPDCAGISDVSDFDGATVSDLVGNLTTVRVATGLFDPTYVASPPPGPAGPDDRLFVVEQRGTVRILDLPTGALLPDFFLNISGVVRDSGNEEGLLSLAFHPDYNSPGAVNEGRFFVYYTNNSGNNQVSRFGIATPNDADESSEEPVITVAHPTWQNHNGGQIAFGPDGHLYILTGDGGDACDPFDAGQNLDDLRGKVLRLDVDAFPPYSTSGNPYDGMAAGLDEIWAYGLRNPWRASFDRETGAFYIGDVGQDRWEEINCQPPTSTGDENYGWGLFEGSDCPNPSCGGSPLDCSTITNFDPIVAYGHTRDGFSCSVTGGFVYRGCRIGDLRGTYFYADFCSNQIRSFRTDAACSTSLEIVRTADLDPPGLLAINRITSFGEDSRGELYVCDRDGDLYKILPELDIMEVSGANANPFTAGPASLSWEDLESTSAHPVSSYKVYRADGDPTGPFFCVHEGTETGWAGGDLQNPPANETFYYLVTARNSDGQETRPGNRSDGLPRTVDTASGCP